MRDAVMDKDILVLILLCVVVALLCSRPREAQPNAIDDEMVVVAGPTPTLLRARQLVEDAEEHVDAVVASHTLDAAVTAVEEHAAQYAGEEACGLAAVDSGMDAARRRAEEHLAHVMLADEEYKIGGEMKAGTWMGLGDEKCDDNMGGGDDEARWCDHTRSVRVRAHVIE
jgi:hypothetical protein